VAADLQGAVKGAHLVVVVQDAPIKVAVVQTAVTGVRWIESVYVV
jgi:hypothetical protein